ncbi:hypothetical protein H4Q26_017566 [Puccinia striiformis f. sp. tritici PST-130]|nr:hypothetical protein H4Q26_017566 [Puccinia striiformis f. sp. tritici PST-130]
MAGKDLDSFRISGKIYYQSECGGLDYFRARTPIGGRLNLLVDVQIGTHSIKWAGNEFIYDGILDVLQKMVGDEELTITKIENPAIEDNTYGSIAKRSSRKWFAKSGTNMGKKLKYVTKQMKKDCCINTGLGKIMWSTDTE